MTGAPGASGSEGKAGPPVSQVYDHRSMRQNISHLNKTLWYTCREKLPVKLPVKPDTYQTGHCVTV